MAESSRESQFLSLFMAHERRIYNFILALAGNYSDADDLLQEVAMVMLDKFDEFEQGSNFLAWAIQIARYKIISFRRKQNRRSILFSEKAINNIIAQYQKILERDEERIMALQSCLLKLSEEDRKLISMRYESDTTTKQVALEMGRSLKGIYQSMARIHRLLQNCIRRTLVAWEMP